MNKQFLTMLILALLVVSAVSVSALNVDVSTLGSSSQKRDLDATATVTITNDGADPISVTGVSKSAGIDAKYNVVLGTPSIALPASLAVGEQMTVPLTAFVPTDFNAVADNLLEGSSVIGQITVNALNATSGSALPAVSSDVTMQAVNELRIRTIKVKVSGSQNKDKTVGENSKVSDLKPGDHLDITIKAENTYSTASSSSSKDNTDINFDDIQINMDISNDNDFDIDEDSETISLDAGDDDTVTFRLDIAEDAADRIHTVVVNVEGLDENGAKHGDTLRFDLDVSRESHDLVFKNAEFFPSTLACGAKTVGFRSELRNQGRNNENDVLVEVKVPELGVDQKSDKFDLDEDDTQTVNMVVILPEDVKPGVYSANIFSLYDLSIQNNLKSLTFTVPDCASKPAESMETPTPVVTTTPTPIVTQPTASGVKASVSFGNSDVYTYALIGGIVLLVVLIALVSMVAFKRK